MFSSTTRLLLPVVIPTFLLGLCKDCLYPALPFSCVNLRVSQHPQLDAPASSPAQSPTDQSSHCSWALSDSLLSAPTQRPLLKQPKGSFDLGRVQSYSSLCSPGTLTLPKSPLPGASPSRRCQGKKGCFSGKVEAQLPFADRQTQQHLESPDPEFQ